MRRKEKRAFLAKELNGGNLKLRMYQSNISRIGKLMSAAEKSVEAIYKSSDTAQAEYPGLERIIDNLLNALLPECRWGYTLPSLKQIKKVVCVRNTHYQPDITNSLSGIHE